MDRGLRHNGRTHSLKDFFSTKGLEPLRLLGEPQGFSGRNIQIFFRDFPRKTAKKRIIAGPFLTPPPSSPLIFLNLKIINYISSVLKKTGNDFFPPIIVGLKEPYSLTNISTNQLKDEDFADRHQNLSCTLEYFDMSS